MAKLYNIDEVALELGTGKANIYKKLSKHSDTYDQYITRNPMRLNEAGLKALKAEAHKRKTATAPTSRTAGELQAELTEAHRQIIKLQSLLIDEQRENKKLTAKLAESKARQLPQIEVKAEQNQRAESKPKPQKLTRWQKLKKALFD